MLPFLTTYDPLGGSSGSIDPLGAIRTYGALADMLLPGVTTITNRSRYLSMLCASLANSERERRFLPGASGLTQRRKAVEPYERLWALACVAARDHEIEKAADGLRGITYAEKSYQNFAINNRRVNPDFKLLKYQSRTGAVGTYWTALVGGQLVDANTGRLYLEGQELANQFPEPPLKAKERRKLADLDMAHRVSMSFSDLVKWGETCHLAAAEADERKQLGEALTADDRRECVSRALKEMAKKLDLTRSWDTAMLKILRRELAEIPRAVNLGLTIVVDAVLATERFHEAVLAVFETLLWWGTQKASKPVDDLIAEKDFRKATDRCREMARKLQKFQEGCELLPVREAICGLTRFAHGIDRSASTRLIVDEIMHRHHLVQSGKVNGGMPKRDWITRNGANLLRPSPRFQRAERPPIASGKLLTHPYRLEPYIHMLRENDVLPHDDE